MFGGLPGGVGGLTRHLCGRMRRHRKLLGILFELPRRFQHPFDDPADLGAEILDKLAQFRLALVHRQLLGADALGFELAALDPVVPENVDGPGDRADFVVAIGMTDVDVGPPLGEAGQRFRHRPQRLGDAADHQYGHPEHEQGGDDRADRHGGERLPQHAVELRRGNADIDDADHFAAVAEHRLIGGVETLPEQNRRAFIGLAVAQDWLRRMIGRELGADCPIAVFLFHVGGAADKLLRCFVVHKQRGIAADIGCRPVHDLVIAEFRHPRNFNAIHHAVPNGDLRVWEGFAEGDAQRAQVGVDVAYRAGVEVARERPVSGPRHQQGIHRNQERGAQDGLWPEVKLQKREAASSKSKCHAGSPGNRLSVRKYFCVLFLRST